jgi:lipid A 3-O-deacylase
MRLCSNLFFAAAVCTATLLCGAVRAADLVAPAPAAEAYVPEPAYSWRALDEVRGGIYAYGVDDPPEGQSVSINVELLTSRLPIGGQAWYVPRLHVGASINTDDAPSHGYAGFSWTVDVTDHFFVEATFGGGIHNGDTGADAPVGESALGCSVLFRESASLGFRFNENWSVMATVEHLSNAGLCDANRGITEAGVRIGYTF